MFALPWRDPEARLLLGLYRQPFVLLSDVQNTEIPDQRVALTAQEAFVSSIYTEFGEKTL